MLLFDIQSAALVLGGTLAATLLRSGWRNFRAAGRAITHLAERSFDSDTVRAELAAQVREIQEDGLVRAVPHHMGDGEFDELSDSLIRHRSIKALHTEHERYKVRRQRAAEAATRVLGDAADLAPVLGLAGTLLALAMSSGAAEADYARSIGTAVITTLYGLVLANFVFSPLAGAIGRRARAEERARQEVLDWLAHALERCLPTGRADGKEAA